MIHDPFDDPGLEVAWEPAPDDEPPARLLRFPGVTVASEFDERVLNDPKEVLDGSRA